MYKNKVSPYWDFTAGENWGEAKAKEWSGSPEGQDQIRRLVYRSQERREARARQRAERASAEKKAEDYNPSQLRAPEGKSEGGQWIKPSAPLTPAQEAEKKHEAALKELLGGTSPEELEAERLKKLSDAHAKQEELEKKFGVRVVADVINIGGTPHLARDQLKYMDEVDRVLTDMTERFPLFADFLRRENPRIELDAAKDGILVEGARTVQGWYRNADSTIRVSTALGLFEDPLMYPTDDPSAKEHRNVTQGFAGVLRHELGHLVRYRAAETQLPKLQGIFVKAKNDFFIAIKEKTGLLTVVADPRDFADNFAGIRDVFPSTYSATHVEELFAEAFAVRTHPGYDPRRKEPPPEGYAYYQVHPDLVNMMTRTGALNRPADIPPEIQKLIKEGRTT